MNTIGGYQVPRVVHTEWACLPDGLYNFTIYDSIADGSAVSSDAISNFFKLAQFIIGQLH